MMTHLTKRNTLRTRASPSHERPPRLLASSMEEGRVSSPLPLTIPSSGSAASEAAVAVVVASSVPTSSSVSRADSGGTSHAMRSMRECACTPCSVSWALCSARRAAMPCSSAQCMSLAAYSGLLSPDVTLMDVQAMSNHDRHTDNHTWSACLLHSGLQEFEGWGAGSPAVDAAAIHEHHETVERVKGGAGGAVDHRNHGQSLQSAQLAQDLRR